VWTGFISLFLRPCRPIVICSISFNESFLLYQNNNNSSSKNKKIKEIGKPAVKTKKNYFCYFFLKKRRKIGQIE